MPAAVTPPLHLPATLFSMLEWILMKIVTTPLISTSTLPSALRTQVSSQSDCTEPIPSSVPRCLGLVSSLSFCGSRKEFSPIAGIHNLQPRLKQPQYNQPRTSIGETYLHGSHLPLPRPPLRHEPRQ